MMTDTADICLNDFGLKERLKEMRLSDPALVPEPDVKPEPVVEPDTAPEPMPETEPEDDPFDPEWPDDLPLPEPKA